MAQFTNDIWHTSGQDNVVADAISATSPHHRTATTSSKHSRIQPPPCASRNYQFRAPRSPSAEMSARRPRPYVPAILRLQVFQSIMICHTQAPKQRRSSSHSVLCGQVCRWIAALGHELASPASTPKSPATQLRVTSRRQQPPPAAAAAAAAM
jgi:hypothetical protein